MYECASCSAIFYYRESCDEHMDDFGHWAECETCTKVFRTYRACNQHMDATGHWAPRYECETCSRSFHSQQAADQHMKANSHYKNYCKECDRRFQNENNLRMHLNSKIHRGSTISCPFCKSNYTTATGLSHHLERGSCPRAPRLNRETIYRMVCERDPHGTITNKQIAWHLEENVTYSANNRAFNGYFWECHICHREFNTIGALNQHLNSPVHKQDVYHCPNRRGRCGRNFATLAAMFNHLESESCGFMRFDNVQKQVKGVVSGNRLISFGS